MEKAQDLGRRLLAFTDGTSFTQTRYLLGAQDPFEMGDLSLGYSNGQLRVYWTKYVGEKGVIDLDIEDLIRVIRECISTCSPFRTDVANLIQNIANQFMPGLHASLPYLGNIFLRPHIEGLQVGFALIFYKSWSSVDVLYNTLKLPIPSPEVFKNVGEKYPFVSFVNRSVHDDFNIGCIRCGLFISQHVNGGVYSEFSIRFLFNSPFGPNITRATHHLRKDATDQNVIGPLNTGDPEVESGNSGGNGTYSDERGTDTRGGREDGKSGKNTSAGKKSSNQESTEKENQPKSHSNESFPTKNNKKALTATTTTTINNKSIVKNMMHTSDIKWKILPFTLVGLAMSLKGFYRLPNLTSVSKM